MGLENLFDCPALIFSATEENTKLRSRYDQAKEDCENAVRG